MPRKHARIGEIVIGLPGKYGTKGDVIGANGLGSCVAVIIYDPITKISSISHVALPKQVSIPKKIKNKAPYMMAGRYADTFIEEAKVRMKIKGSRIINLEAKIAGGSAMFGNQDVYKGGTINMGKRNVAAVKKHLNEANIKIISEDILGNLSRTVWYDVDNQSYIITNAMNGSIKII